MSSVDTAKYNPKKDKNYLNPPGHRKRKSFKFDFGSAEDPMSELITDPKEYLQTFARFPFLPYAGTSEYSNHRLLAFLDSARYLSPSLGACIESIKTHLFGLGLDVEVKTENDFDIEEEEEVLSVEDKREYLVFLKTIKLIGLDGYLEMEENKLDEYLNNGNYWMVVTHCESMGEYSSSIEIKKTQECCYMPTKKGGLDFIGISPCWEYNYLLNNTPEIIPKYPFYSENKRTKTYKTIIHVKHGNFRIYGRPPMAPAWINCFREHQDEKYLLHSAAKRFTGEVFIELEDGDPENDAALDDDASIGRGYTSAMDEFEDHFSAQAEGNMQAAFVTSRPSGAGKAFIYQFKPVTNEKFFDSNNKRNRQKIIEVMQWSERLLGNAKSEGFSKDSAYISEVKIKDISTLAFYRKKLMSGTFLALSECAKWQGNKKMQRLTPKFKTYSEFFKQQQKLEENERNVSNIED